MKTAIITILLLGIANIFQLLTYERELKDSISRETQIKAGFSANLARRSQDIEALHREIAAREANCDELSNTLSSCIAERDQAINLLKSYKIIKPIPPIPGTLTVYQ